MTKDQKAHLPLRLRRLLGAGSAVLLCLAACGADEEDPSSDSSVGSSGEVTVSAAASLTEAFTQLGKDFEDANPGADVQFNFEGSSTLAQQINQGAPVDVFAAADQAQMQVVVEADRVAGAPTIFVANKLQIVVPKGNPAQVDDLAAFGEPELAIAFCAEEVPCGAAAQEAFELAGLSPAPDTLEQDVKAVLTKVGLGEADAGLVYVSDVISAGGNVEGIDFPEANRAINHYPIAVLQDAPNAAAAEAFVDYVLSDQGSSVLKEFGFIIDVP